MEGGGIFTALATVLFGSSQQLSQHERKLRRATRPLGVAAVIAWCVWQFGMPRITHALAPLIAGYEEWLAVAAGIVLLYGLALFVTGVSGSLGVRSDGMLPMWAFFELATGVAGLVWLPKIDLARALDVGPRIAVDLRLLLTAVLIWCAVVGAARFVLLTVGGGSALARIKRHIHQTQLVMRPARRPWWKFW